MNISDQDVQKKNPKYLRLKRHQQKGKKKKVAQNLYMEKNPNVLLI